MKKSYVIIIILIAAALLLGAVYLTSNGDDGSTNTGTGNETSENTGSEASNSQQVVAYDGSGFSPASLTVSVGDTVTFRNESATDVWPASAVHPTHGELPGFDALEGLGQGEEYEFTFEQTGEWGYHNHLDASQTGVIIVE